MAPVLSSSGVCLRYRNERGRGDGNASDESGSGTLARKHMGGCKRISKNVTDKYIDRKTVPGGLWAHVLLG